MIRFGQVSARLSALGRLSGFGQAFGTGSTEPSPHPLTLRTPSNPYQTITKTSPDIPPTNYQIITEALPKLCQTITKSPQNVHHGFTTSFTRASPQLYHILNDPVEYRHQNPPQIYQALNKPLPKHSPTATKALSNIFPTFA